MADIQIFAVPEFFAVSFDPDDVRCWYGSCIDGECWFGDCGSGDCTSGTTYS